MPVAITVLPECAIVHSSVVGVTVALATGKGDFGRLSISDVFRKKGDTWLWVAGHKTEVR
jgi:hypothetical protein